MQEGQKNKSPMIIVIDSIAYFLAGSFALNTAITIESSGEITTIKIANLLTFVVSLVLILVGFGYLISTFKFLPGLITSIRERLLLKRPKLVIFLTICKAFTFIRKIQLHLKPWFTAILVVFLFTITSSQVLTVVFNYYNNNVTPLFIVSAIFLFILLVSIVYTSRQIFSNVHQLLTMIIALNAIGIYKLFTGDFTGGILFFIVNISIGKLELVTILIIILIFAILAIAAWSKQSQRQLRLKL